MDNDEFTSFPSSPLSSSPSSWTEQEPHRDQAPPRFPTAPSPPSPPSFTETHRGPETSSHAPEPAQDEEEDLEAQNDRLKRELDELHRREKRTLKLVRYKASADTYSRALEVASSSHEEVFRMQQKNCELMAQSQQMVIHTMQTLHQGHIQLAQSTATVAQHVQHMAAQMGSAAPPVPVKSGAEIAGETLQVLFRSLSTFGSAVVGARVKGLLPAAGGGESGPGGLDLAELLGQLGISLPGGSAAGAAPAGPAAASGGHAEVQETAAAGGVRCTGEPAGAAQTPDLRAAVAVLIPALPQQARDVVAQVLADESARARVQERVLQTIQEILQGRG